MVNVNQNQLGSVTTIINYLVGYILQKYNRNMNDTGIILAVYVNLLINYIVLNPTILPTNFNAVFWKLKIMLQLLFVTSLFVFV